MSLPSYDEFKQLRINFLKNRELEQNKEQYVFADLMYVKVGEYLRSGRIDVSTDHAPWEGRLWISLLQQRCLKEGWYAKPDYTWCTPGCFTMKHTSQMNFLEKWWRTK